jgi:hypothetical protein
MDYGIASGQAVGARCWLRSNEIGHLGSPGSRQYQEIGKTYDVISSRGSWEKW